MNYQHSPFAQSVGFGTTKRKQVRAVQVSGNLVPTACPCIDETRLAMHAVHGNRNVMKRDHARFVTKMEYRANIGKFRRKSTLT